MSSRPVAAALPASDVRKYKLVFLGDQESGKTSIIQRAIDDTFPKRYLATVGVDFVSKTMKIPNEDDDGESKSDPRHVKLQLWDTAGQERFKASIPSYIRDSHVAVITFDISNREQFDNIQKWIKEVREIRGDDVVIWLVATKVDMPLYDRKVSWLEMEKTALQSKTEFMQVSAKAGYNIRELFYEMTQKLPRVQAETKLTTSSARF
ncbi:Ras-related protein Rab [Seminavis robusta]|uniref:Ras-related protein Rab n=1 Tax=Seminavis robusta TaxID=568900 RepID=A0A9N8E3E1_9STRA|nr:Ras-related protein Rab [Seminavis robusta]|eukprot:Sro608_g174870.1 Ras-related protein Rab (207) ;mRNA; f:35541-36161